MLPYRLRNLVGLLALLTFGAGCSPSGQATSEPTRSTETTPPESAGARESTETPDEGPTATPTGPSPLLPNLRSLPPDDVALGWSEDGERALRFSGILANDGIGPIVMRPDDRPECPEGQRHASQVIHLDRDDDGKYDPGRDTATEVRPAGCLLFHPDHDHWHLDASARYTLTRPGADTPVAEQDKVSFCLRDSERLPDPEFANAPDRFGECERDEIQGISIGWTDVYESDLPGQALVLPEDLRDGMYCLEVSADPLDLLREEDETDNTAVVGVRIAGDEVTQVESTGCNTG